MEKGKEHVDGILKRKENTSSNKYKSNGKMCLEKPVEGGWISRTQLFEDYWSEED